MRLSLKSPKKRKKLSFHIENEGDGILSWAEIGKMRFQREKELEERKKEHFLDWIQETAEAEEKAELRQRIRNLELENESLQEFYEQKKVEPTDAVREEFAKDMKLSDEAEVLGEMLAEKEIDAHPENPIFRSLDALDRQAEEPAEPAESIEEKAEAVMEEPVSTSELEPEISAEAETLSEELEAEEVEQDDVVEASE